MFMRRLRPRSAKGELVIAGLSILIAIITGIDWMGKPLHLVHVLTLVAAGMVGGAGFARAIHRLQDERAE